MYSPSPETLRNVNFCITRTPSWHSKVTSGSKSGTFAIAITPSPTITSDRLLGSVNYHSWSRSVMTWFHDQGYEDHLTTKAEDVPVKDRFEFQKLDALLCIMLWNSIDSKILDIYQVCETCYEVWTKAKSFYNNDVQRLYNLVFDMVHLKQGPDMCAFVGKLKSLKQELNSLMPVTGTVEEQLAQRDKLIIMLGLIALQHNLAPIRDQILTSAVMPTLDELCTRLLRVSSFTSIRGKFLVDHLILAPETTPREAQGRVGGHGDISNNRPKCNYCHKWGHVTEQCHKLHGKPSRIANVVQTDHSKSQHDTLGQSPSSFLLTGSDLDDYLRFKISKLSSPVVTSVVQSGAGYVTDDWHRT